MTGVRYLVQPSPNIIYGIPPNEYTVKIPVRDVVSKIFEGSGRGISYQDVNTVETSDPRYLGSKINQLNKLRNESKLNIVLNHDSVLVTSRNIAAFTRNPLIIDGSSPRVIKQITMDKEGVVFRTLFNNNLSLLRNTRIVREQLNPNVNGDYVIYQLKHELSAHMPDGKFFSEVKAFFLNGAAR